MAISSRSTRLANKKENLELITHHSQKSDEKTKNKELEKKGWKEMHNIGTELYGSIAKATTTSSAKAQITDDALKMMSIIYEMSGRLKMLDEEGNKTKEQYKHLLGSSEKIQIMDCTKIEELLKKCLNESVETSQGIKAEVQDILFDMMKQVVIGKEKGERIETQQIEAKQQLEDIKMEIKQINSKKKEEEEKKKEEKMDKILEEMKIMTKRMTEINKERKGINKTEYEEIINTYKEKQKADIKLKEQMDKIRKATEEIKEDNKKGKEIMEEIKNTQKEYIKTPQGRETETKRKNYTYAERVKEGIKEQPRATYHSIIVNSTDENKTGEEVFSEIRKTAEGKEEWCEVVKVKKAKDRKVIISCTKEEEVKKLKQTLEVNNKLQIEKARNKNPLIIVRNVKGENKTEQAIEAIRRKIEKIGKRGLEQKEEIEKAYEKKTKNPHVANVVLRVDPLTWQQLTEAGSVQLRWGYSIVEDQSPLIQCSRCLGYGHSKRFCKEQLDRCCHCGEDHLYAACKNKDIPPKCRNCMKDANNKGELNHNAFSNICPIRLRMDKLARTKTSYC
ncbi:unnamed protein product [Diatraea saccharalis]|uniref:Uncharacterized protein n=1 Tax=Diatraea saccharalis TaxID=40085 RepID=A0A9N9QUX6_9NEOP|nr:unnamed protein product [Diatraea saccharalis]